MRTCVCVRGRGDYAYVDVGLYNSFRIYTCVYIYVSIKIIVSLNIGIMLYFCFFFLSK